MSTNNATLEVSYEEQTLRLTYTYTPGDPGQTSGPPERCYSPEPEELEISKIELRCEPPEDMLHNPRYKRACYIDITDMMWAAAGKDVSAQLYQDLEELILEFIRDEEEPDYEPDED